MEKIFFINTYTYYFVNGANRSYWAKVFKLFSNQLHEKNRILLHSSFDENMPIYEYHSDTKKKYVRIMQFNPLSELVNLDQYSDIRYYTAWIDKRTILREEDSNTPLSEEPELVVCLLMTRANIDKAKGLIRAWLFEDDDKTNSIIQNIYLEQERLDKDYLQRN